MCNCIEEINEKFRQEYKGGAVSAFMDKPGWSEIAIKPLTREMEPAKHRRYRRADWEFCPFCGEAK